MDKNQEQVSNGQGPDYTKFEVPPVTKVRELVKKDLSVCLNLLEAIYRDENTLNAVADYLHGRMVNEKNRQEIKKQAEIPFAEN